jgi:ATP-binding cassette subfamily C (CFTR/MRP) protein 10
MTELLSGIRVIKFFGWEQALGTRVEACRAQELGRLRIIKYLDAACVYLWAALPVIISIAIFTTYVLLGHQLTATKVRIGRKLWEGGSSKETALGWRCGLSPWC